MALLGITDYAGMTNRQNIPLSRITTAGGVPFTVASDYATRFKGLLDDLEAHGVKIDPGQSGGYNFRNIAGTNTLSQHAFGRAVDVNWDQNPRGGKGQLDPELARSLAQKWGMTWGGDWKNPDSMHFEINRGADWSGNTVATADANKTAATPISPDNRRDRDSYAPQPTAVAQAGGVGGPIGTPTAYGAPQGPPPQTGDGYDLRGFQQEQAMHAAQTQAASQQAAQQAGYNTMWGALSQPPQVNMASIQGLMQRLSGPMGSGQGNLGINPSGGFFGSMG